MDYREFFIEKKRLTWGESKGRGGIRFITLNALVDTGSRLAIVAEESLVPHDIGFVVADYLNWRWCVARPLDMKPLAFPVIKIPIGLLVEGEIIQGDIYSYIVPEDINDYLSHENFRIAIENISKYNNMSFEETLEYLSKTYSSIIDFLVNKKIPLEERKHKIDCIIGLLTLDQLSLTVQDGRIVHVASLILTS